MLAPQASPGRPDRHALPAICLHRTLRAMHTPNKPWWTSACHAYHHDARPRLACLQHHAMAATLQLLVSLSVLAAPHPPPASAPGMVRPAALQAGVCPRVSHGLGTCVCQPEMLSWRGPESRSFRQQACWCTGCGPGQGAGAAPIRRPPRRVTPPRPSQEDAAPGRATGARESARHASN